MQPELIDYAHPCMMAEKALKELHDAMLRHDYAAAMKAGLNAMVEVRMTMNAINYMKESADELAKTQTV